MGNKTRAVPPLLLMAVAVAFWGLTAAVAGPVSTGPPGTQSQSAMEPVGSDYIGEETCVECHQDRADSYWSTPHGRVQDSRTPAAKMGCESCHGPAREHAEEGDPDLMTPLTAMPASRVSETCTTCHNRGEHAFWQGSQHDGRDLSCINCHSVHEPKSERAQLVAATQVETCERCHQDKAAKIQRTSHMPVREGQLECTSCHNPHGSANERLLRTGFTVNESCTTGCHAEKRGPFLWEHAPVTENCTTCHDPHGSSNDRLLVAKAPMLCQRCHSHTRHPARPYDASNTPTAPQAYGRACLNCHQNVHGSNHPSGRFFLR